MSKMGQIAAMVQDGRSDDLKKMIKAAERNKRDEVYFLGKTYSMADAKQILMFMHNEERTIYRIKQPPK